ncbi:MAG: FAD-dependent oxidoreductase [Candidatus Competibacteraceae bacterium]|nr:FAD-dependent oxidoreductase [Candidatus Competibacteraceae bacterium]
MVLLGGGHSHVEVIRRLALDPLTGWRIILVNRQAQSPYSGMVPGHIAGHYTFNDCHIDLAPLTRRAGIELLQAEAQGLDLDERRVLLQDQMRVSYDLLSIDLGSRPQMGEVPGAAEHALPIKPIDRFLVGWNRLVERILNENRLWRIAVVGAGAGGVELTLAAQYRLDQLLSQAGRDPGSVTFHLFSNSCEVMTGHNPRVQRRFRRVLTERGVQLHTGQPVTRVTQDAVERADGQQVAADAVLWTTSASPHPWLAEAGLAVDKRGFVAVNDCLRSLSHPAIFAAGDVAAMVDFPRPKAGVFAVRQGPPLAENLRRAALGQSLKAHHPQKHYLSLITTGDRYAVASRGRWSWAGAWLWRVKDHIDRKFMARYNDLPISGQ